MKDSAGSGPTGRSVGLEEVEEEGRARIRDGQEEPAVVTASL